MDSIGYKIKAIREERRYSQEYMASVLNITQASYSRIESGLTRLSLDKLYAISQLLKIDINLLLKECNTQAGDSPSAE